MPLYAELSTAIKYKNFSQAIFILSITPIFSFKKNILLGILYYENMQYKESLSYLNSENTEYFVTILYYKALAAYKLKKIDESIHYLNTILEEEKSFKQEIFNKNEDFLDKILSFYKLEFDAKFINYFLGNLYTENEKSNLSIINYKKSVSILESFLFLYENLYINEKNFKKYFYSDIQEKNEFDKDIESNKNIEFNKNIELNDFDNDKEEIAQKTAFHFKILRNELLEFLLNPKITNLKIIKYKKILSNSKITQNNFEFIISIKFLQSAAYILFTNHQVSDSHFIFLFLFEKNLLELKYKMIWSTILWLRRDEKLLGILSRNVLTDVIFNKNESNDKEFNKNLEDLHVSNSCHIKWIILSNYFSVCSDHNRSLICLKKSIFIKKNFYSILLTAHELMIRHEMEKSINLFYKVLRMNSNCYSAFYGIGNILSKNGENSEHFFRMANKIVPKNKAVLFQIIRTLVSQNEYEKGLIEIHKYYEMILDEEEGVEKIEKSEKMNKIVDEIMNFLKILFKNKILNKNKRNECNDLILLEFIEILIYLNELNLANIVSKLICKFDLKTNEIKYRKLRDILNKKLINLEDE